jgi:hypothetical protein
MYFSIGLLSVVGSLARTYRHKVVMSISVVVGSWQSIINWKWWWVLSMAETEREDELPMVG